MRRLAVATATLLVLALLAWWSTRPVALSPDTDPHLPTTTSPNPEPLAEGSPPPSTPTLVPSRFGHTTPAELAARRDAKALRGPISDLRRTLSAEGRAPTNEERALLMAWERDPNRRSLRVLRRAVSDARAAMMYVQSPHTETLYEQELDLLAMLDGDAPSSEQVRTLACTLVRAPRDCVPDAWPWCFGADKLADVSARLCADPDEPVPDAIDQREGDWVRTWNGSSRQRYGPVTPSPP